MDGAVLVKQRGAQRNRGFDARSAGDQHVSVAARGHPEIPEIPGRGFSAAWLACGFRYGDGIHPGTALIGFIVGRNDAVAACREGVGQRLLSGAMHHGNTLRVGHGIPAAVKQRHGGIIVAAVAGYHDHGFRRPADRKIDAAGQGLAHLDGGDALILLPAFGDGAGGGKVTRAVQESSRRNKLLVLRRRQACRGKRMGLSFRDSRSKGAQHQRKTDEHPDCG